MTCSQCVCDALRAAMACLFQPRVVHILCLASMYFTQIGRAHV